MASRTTEICRLSPVLLFAILAGLLAFLLAQGCSSSGGADSEKGASGGMTGTGGATASGGKSLTSGTDSAGAASSSSGGASSGGAGSGGAGRRSSGTASGSGGSSSGSAGAGGAGSGGVGGSSSKDAGSGGTGAGGSVSSGDAGRSGTGTAGTGGTGTAGSSSSGTAGRSGSGGTGSSSTGSGAGNTGAGGGSSGGTTGPGSTAGSSAFNPCPAAGEACKIMPLGDSITDGVGSSQGGGYRVELFHKAVQAHKAITFVGSATHPNGPATVDGKTFPRNHEGHPGYTVDNSSTTSGISPLVDASISANHPNIITLMIGTNDLNRNVDPTNFPTRLGALLDKIIKDAPNALVVVAKITPWQDDGTNTSAVEPFNTKIATLVQTYMTGGKHVALVDMYTPLRANTNYKTALMGDYLHPNDAGYVVMGDVWYSAIENYLPAAP